MSMKYALTYGGIGGLIAISIICASLALDTPSHSEWFGYLVMLAALSMIFVGVKRFRDVECGGVIRFGRAFAVGLGIAVVASVVYVIGWEIFQFATGWDFMADYTASIIQTMRDEGASQAAISAKITEMHGFAEQYHNPLFRIPMTFAEIFPVGLLVALVSAALLRNPKFLSSAR
jgi:hypothetical protein